MNQFALFPIFAALVVAPAMAQTKPPTNSVTLAWTNPTTYTTGQALTIGQVTVFFDNSATSISGAPTTFTTSGLVGGTHSFTVVVCDNMSPANCSPASAAATVTVPATPLAIPAASNLTAVVNPGAAPPSQQSASAPVAASATAQGKTPAPSPAQASPIQESPMQSQRVVPKLNCAIFQRLANGSWVQLHPLSAGGRTINLSGPIITEGTVVSGIDLVAALNQQCR